MSGDLFNRNPNNIDRSDLNNLFTHIDKLQELFEDKADGIDLTKLYKRFKDVEDLKTSSSNEEKKADNNIQTPTVTINVKSDKEVVEDVKE